MRQRRDDAYVLGTRELGEADLVVTLVAENSGRVRGVASSARKSRRRFGGTLEPMTRVRATWVERPGRDLHRIEALDLTRSYATMQADPARQAACAILAEISTAVAREEQGDPRSFRLLGATLDALEEGLEPWSAVRYFEFWTLRLHGVLPDPTHCGGCGVELGKGDPLWVAGRQGIRCGSCAAAGDVPVKRLSSAEIAFLAAAATAPPSGIAAHRRVCGPGGSLETLLTGALESFVERSFRTYRHLRAQTRSELNGKARP